MLFRELQVLSAIDDHDEPAIMGVIGPPSSDETIEVQNLLQIARKPQIGYSATGSSLSDKSKYGYFVRVVPSDQYQAKVMVGILKELNWTYIHALSTVGTY